MRHHKNKHKTASLEVQTITQSKNSWIYTEQKNNNITRSRSQSTPHTEEHIQGKTPEPSTLESEKDKN